MPVVRTHRVRAAPILSRCRQIRKILPQSRFRVPFRQTVVFIGRLYRTIPQSLRDSSLYTREPLGVRHPPAFLSTKAPDSNLSVCWGMRIHMISESSSVPPGHSWVVHFQLFLYEIPHPPVLGRSSPIFAGKPIAFYRYSW